MVRDGVTVFVQERIAWLVQERVTDVLYVGMSKRFLHQRLVGPGRAESAGHSTQDATRRAHKGVAIAETA